MDKIEIVKSIMEKESEFSEEFYLPYPDYDISVHAEGAPQELRYNYMIWRLDFSSTLMYKLLRKVSELTFRLPLVNEY